MYSITLMLEGLDIMVNSIIPAHAVIANAFQFTV
jgi:hypothetical protein